MSCRLLPACVILLLPPPQNSYGTGLTDWDNCSMYGKLALFIFAAWAGQAVSAEMHQFAGPAATASAHLDTVLLPAS